MNLADRIQNLRKVKGISQEELADKIGVSRQAVSKWESEQSIPDIDKIIIMSDYFAVTTDYILKGIETNNQVDKEKAVVNARIFMIAATVLNFIGVILSCAVWYEEQTPMAIVVGLIVMSIGCTVFGVGQVISTENIEKAKKDFWIINIWLLIFIPLAIIYNLLFTNLLAPYPLLVSPIITFHIFWLVYLSICFAVVLIQKIKREK